MLSATNNRIRLALKGESGELVAEITRVGAALRYLALDGVELVEPGNFDSLSPFCEGVVMAPWPNRTDGGKWMPNRTPITAFCWNTSTRFWHRPKHRSLWVL